jgi:hypothetical protein
MHADVPIPSSEESVAFIIFGRSEISEEKCLSYPVPQTEQV